MMRLPAKLLASSLILLLAACANNKDKDMQDSVSAANFKLGIGYMQSGHMDVATEKLLKAVQHNDNYPEAHNALGVIYEETREYGPAETHYKRAIDLKPDYVLAKVNYARLLCTREPIRIAEGESILQKVVADPNNAGATAADAHAGLGVCALHRNQPDEAETWLRKALDQNPKNNTALYQLAQISQTQGKALQGRAFLQRYHSQSPPTPQSLWLGYTIESLPEGDAQLRREYKTVLLSQFPNTEEAQRLNSRK